MKLLLIWSCVILSTMTASAAAPWRPNQANFTVFNIDSSIKKPQQFKSDSARNQAVQALMQQAYLKGDSRALGQAERLMKQSNNPNLLDNLMLGARVAQANHRFDAAKDLLKQALKQQPQQYDAILQLSNIERLQGNFKAALNLCAQLEGYELAVYRFGCEYQIQAMQQPLAVLKTNNQSILSSMPQLSGSDQEWLANIQLEIATRFKDAATANVALKYLKQDSLPNAIAKSNWYISQKQYAQVLALLKNYRYHDGALIRIILSKQALKDATFKADLQLLSSRMQQLQARKEQIHLREEAQYLLLKGQNQRGLQIAAQNWQIQRESDDFQVYAALAMATQDQASAKILLQWSKQVGYRDPQYLPALQRLLTGAAT